MFLKSLTLKGFKSFADPTTLEFEPGVTVVVGPNGSGKSNVVDAVAWVLGAQGPRTLRSTKMEDVIFAGTPNRQALGRAEVSLTIDNSAGLLPIDFTEVTLTRTLFRTGESEYAINRVPCRLLDIQELLSDTGVGRQQHVIVSQGNLDSILSSRPEERRLVIEEAAGVLKFRRRKEKAERRLESTEASLVRLTDLLREVRRQLRPLEKQAEAARRHGDLVDELSAVRRHLFGRELASAEGRLVSAAADRASFTARDQELRDVLSRLDAEILTSETQGRDQSSDGTVDLAEAISRGEGLKARAGGLLAVLAERLRSTDRALGATVDHDLIASLEAEAAALAERLASADEEADRLLPAADELSTSEADLERESSRLEADWQHTGTTGAGAASEVRGELAALRSGLERSGGEAGRLEINRHTVEGRARRLAAETQRLAAVAAEVEGESVHLADAERGAEQAEQTTQEQLAAAETELRSVEAEQHRWEARVESLSAALDAARARAGAERLSEIGGVVGTLLELVEVDEGFGAAFEAAAGDALAAVIVDGVGSARRGLAELIRRSSSGAVLALPELNPTAIGPSLAPGVGASAAGDLAEAEYLRPHVRARLPAVGELLDRMLGSSLVVDGGWEIAIDIALARPDLVVVTRAGDRCAGGLWRVGTAGNGATAAALEEARRQSEAADGRVIEARSDFGRAREALEDARRTRSQAGRATEANEARRRVTADALSRAEVELAEARSEEAGLLAQAEELTERLARERSRVSELAELLPSLEKAAEAEAERTAAERAARSRLAERTAGVAAMRRDLEVRIAGLEERRQLTTRRLREVEERLKNNVAEREGAADRRQALEQTRTVVQRIAESVRARHQEIDAILGRLREARQAEADTVRARVDLLERLRRERAVAEKHLAEVRERLGRIGVEEAESRVRLEGLTEAVRRDLDCEVEGVRGYACPPLPVGTSAPSRKAELERELRLMGPINPLALEEHTALHERHQFLEAQLEDVRSARRELTKVIRAIDAEIVEIFQAAYADVADNFEVLFATLFPGGQGRLRLTEPDHLLETGIEVEARPSGKNVRRLSLLSGGERSLTAMAFLFAVFRSRPSPFYLMDEVEAALDDVNLHRFLDLVHEFRAEAQLLIVSHQKRTMEAADCLYGVTMPPGGSSRVISERVTATVTP